MYTSGQLSMKDLNFVQIHVTESFHEQFEYYQTYQIYFINSISLKKLMNIIQIHYAEKDA